MREQLRRTLPIGALVLAACGGPVGTAGESYDLAEVGSKEIWVAAQATAAIKVVAEDGSQESIALATGSQPHMIDLSPSGNYGYTANVGHGTMNVIRTADRAVIATLSFGATAGTHQVKPSWDGATLLVAQIPTRRLIKIAADEANESWTVAGELLLSKSPICTVFSTDNSTAYVSLAGSEVAVVDVATMTELRRHPVGNVQCGLTMSKAGNKIYVTDNGAGGRFYTLDLSTTPETLTNSGAVLNMGDLHGSALNANEDQAILTDRAGDVMKRLTLSDNEVETFSLDTNPDAPDAPEQVVVADDEALITLGNAGKVARFKRNRIQGFIDVAPPAFGSGIFGRSVHGISVRKIGVKVINIGDPAG